MTKKMGLLFASMIVVILLVFLLVLGAFSTDIKNDKVYIVYSKSFSSSFDARRESTKVKLMGGGGNVFLHKGMYYVSLSSYFEKMDAEYVFNNIKESAGGVLELEIDVENEDATLAVSLSEKLFDISERFDRGGIDALIGGKEVLLLVREKLDSLTLNKFEKKEREYFLSLIGSLNSLAMCDPDVFSYRIKEMGTKLLIDFREK